SASAILLAIEDVTRRRETEREKDELLQQKEILLQEMQHRVANSLQIIASILLLKARTVQSEETRHHLHDAHQRVMSVATVQQQLQANVLLWFLDGAERRRRIQATLNARQRVK